MKKYQKQVIIFFFLCFIWANNYAMNYYSDYIEYAEKAFDQKRYEDAGTYYDMAFQRWQGYKEHLYEASRAWAYFGDKEQAFYYANRAVEMRFYDRNKILNDEPYKNGLGSNYLDLILVKIQIESASFERGINDSLRQVLLNIAGRNDELRKGKERKRIDSLFADRNCLENQNYWAKVKENDRLNVEIFIQLYSDHGWPDIRLVGEKANKTACFIVQHADSLIQKRFLPVIEQSCQRNETPWKYYAHLYDRIIADVKGKVKFGCEPIYNPTTGSVSMVFENPGCVNYYREQMGLPPLDNFSFDLPCSD